MTEELLKKLHTAMCNDNEHQCNRLNNYIHTDEYLTAEVVKVVREIVEEATKELQEALKGKRCNCMTYFNFKDLEKQLTKAKEILAKLLEEEKNNMYWEMNGSDKSSYYEVRKQAEQFLKNNA